jgi:hypothetical protein
VWSTRWSSGGLERPGESAEEMVERCDRLLAAILG